MIFLEMGGRRPLRYLKAGTDKGPTNYTVHSHDFIISIQRDISSFSNRTLLDFQWAVNRWNQ